MCDNCDTLRQQVFELRKENARLRAEMGRVERVIAYALAEKDDSSPEGEKKK